MSIQRRVVGIGAVVVVLAALLFFGNKKIRAMNAKKADSASVAGKAAVPIRPDTAPITFGAGTALPVVGAEVMRADLIVWSKALGQAAPSLQYIVPTEAAGRITRVFVQEGQLVRKGDTLITLDTTEFAFSLEQARNSLRQAEANYKIATISEHRVEDPVLRATRDTAFRMQAGLPQAELSLKRALLEYSKTATLAPFDGVVSNLKVVPGQRVTGEVLTLSSINPIRVEARVLQNEVGSIRRGNRARLRFAQDATLTYEGVVESINPLIDEMRTARVTIAMSNPNAVILPGMTAQVEIQSVTYPDLLLVPRKSILQRSEGRDLLLVYMPSKDGEDGLADWRYVALGRYNDEFIEILPGTDGSQKLVEPGEIVLVDGHYTIAHQTAIKLVDRLTSITR